jgi:hypothetical protein
MKKKEKRRNFSDLDKFDRKQKKHSAPKEKGSSKHKFSIYEEFEDEDSINYSTDYDDLND